MNKLFKESQLIYKFMSVLPEWSCSYNNGHVHYYVSPFSPIGKKYGEFPEVPKGYVFIPNESSVTETYLIPSCDGQFHQDWRWLMAVVNHIESLQLTIKVLNPAQEAIDNVTMKFVFNISGNKCSIDCKSAMGTTKNFIGLKEVKSDDKIKATYKKVVRFIEWYNNQKIISDFLK